MCYVYKIVFPDSRIYIGITKNLNSRLNQHSRSKQLCGQLIRHFGIQNVIYESIFEGTLAECLEIEELLVDAEWLKNPRCVNMCTGGSAGAAFTGKSHTQSSKDKISNSLKGRTFSKEHRIKIGAKSRLRLSGVRLSEAHCENMRKAAILRYSKMSQEDINSKHRSMLNKQHSEETKVKMANSHNKGPAHHNAKAIIMIDKNGNETEFGSIALASSFLGTNANGITKALTGKTKTGYGYYWKYKILSGHELTNHVEHKV